MGYSAGFTSTFTAFSKLGGAYHEGKLKKEETERKKKEHALKVSAYADEKYAQYKKGFDNLLKQYSNASTIEEKNQKGTALNSYQQKWGKQITDISNELGRDFPVPLENFNHTNMMDIDGFIVPEGTTAGEGSFRKSGNFLAHDSEQMFNQEKGEWESYSTAVSDISTVDWLTGGNRNGWTLALYEAHTSGLLDEATYKTGIAMQKAGKLTSGGFNKLLTEGKSIDKSYTAHVNKDVSGDVKSIVYTNKYDPSDIKTMEFKNGVPVGTLSSTKAENKEITSTSGNDMDILAGVATPEFTELGESVSKTAHPTKEGEEGIYADMEAPEPIELSSEISEETEGDIDNKDDFRIDPFSEEKIAENLEEITSDPADGPDEEGLRGGITDDILFGVIGKGAFNLGKTVYQGFGKQASQVMKDLKRIGQKIFGVDITKKGALSKGVDDSFTVEAWTKAVREYFAKAPKRITGGAAISGTGTKLLGDDKTMSDVRQKEDEQTLKVIQSYEDPKGVGLHVPNNKGIVVGNSGVTTSGGVDFGQQTADSLSKAGVPKKIINKTRVFLGKKKDTALSLLKKHKGLLSKQEMKVIDTALMKKNKEELNAFPNFVNASSEIRNELIQLSLHTYILGGKVEKVLMKDYDNDKDFVKELYFAIKGTVKGDKNRRAKTLKAIAKIYKGM